MLDDFTSSARGPGVVGLVLATVVLAFLSVLAVQAITYTRDDTLRKEVSAQKLRIEDLKGFIAHGDRELEKFRGYAVEREKLTVLESELATLVSEGEVLGSEIDGLEQEIAEIEGEFAEYQVNYRVAQREGAVGEIIDLSETHGESYKAVKITRVNPSAMGVMTDSGPKRLSFEDLPAAVQDRFQYDPEEAKEYLAARERLEEARTRQIREIEQRKSEERAESKAAERERFRKQALVEADSLRAKADRARGQAEDFRRRADRARSDHADAAARGNVSSHLARSRDFERKARAAVRYAAQCDAKAMALERKWK